jgi:hypothetical protein
MIGKHQCHRAVRGESNRVVIRMVEYDVSNQCVKGILNLLELLMSCLS